MGSMVTRPGLHGHAYAAMPQPRFVTEHAVAASIPHPQAGQTIYPLSAPFASFAADGAPFYVAGYHPGQAAQMPGGRIDLSLPPRAAQIDLTDSQSWDRPVFWPGAA